MRRTAILLLLAVCAGLMPPAKAQTQKPLTNSDIVNMTKQGFDAGLIVKAIQSSATDFDVSAQALVELKNAGVQQSVMEAMLSSHAGKPAANVAAHGSENPTDKSFVDTSKPVCKPDEGCLLREGTEIPLKFVNAISSKTANQGDPVEFLLDNDVKVGDVPVVAKGAHAVAEVSSAKKAGMMGKPGDLSVQLKYLNAGNSHIRLRGTKGKEGEGKTGTAVALTVLFGPIGLIKHGKNVEIAAGTPFTAYVDQDIWLAPVK